MGFEFGDAFDFNEAAEVKRSSRNDNPAGLCSPKNWAYTALMGPQYSLDGV